MIRGLAGQLPEQLSSSLNLGASYRALQVFQWIHRGARSFSEMTNLPAAMREKLSEDYPRILTTDLEQRQKDSADGSQKFTLRLSDGLLVESVLLQDGKGRFTACLSSQVGCAMGCRFCRTASMGLKRNLTSSEIVEQLLHLKSLAPDITHIVFMGMGEPLANLEEVRSAIAIIHHSEAHNIGHRRITLSTCGLAEEIKGLAVQGPPVKLAVSLVAPRDELRSQLMPINRKYPLADLKRALLEYQRLSGKRITLEYVLLKGYNDTLEDLQALTSFCSGLSVLINLIPWNPAAELPFVSPSVQETDQFARAIEHLGIPVSKRMRKGRGINGACGQLAVDI